MGISLGLVGLGAFGSAFAELFMRHPAVSRIGLCDMEPDRIAKFADQPLWQASGKLHPRDCYASLDDICRSDLDALVVITQHWLHAPQCLQALESGKHVYSAVPIICIPDGLEILDWCDKLVDAVKRTGRHYMLGETTCYHADSMFCRRQAAAGAFGSFVYSEGEYLHAYDSPGCDLRKVLAHRRASKIGAEYDRIWKSYADRGTPNGPMHYPTHSTSGPMWVMNAHATKVCAWGTPPHTDDPYFQHAGEVYSNETALFHMSNGATMRICEFREIQGAGRETFRLYGTGGSYENGVWATHTERRQLTTEEMRDPLPPEVQDAWRSSETDSVMYGGHGGSHAYLVHEFCDAIANDRMPAINVWWAARFVAAGVAAHQSALRDGELTPVPDWGNPPA